MKRKKIVAENHLKKIPKSPLRNPLQTKHKQNPEEPSLSVLPSAAGSHKKHNCVPARPERQFTKQNGETPGMTAEASESGDSVSPKKASSPHHRSELRRWRSEGSDPARFSGLDGQQDSSSSSSKTRTSNSECSSLCYSTTPPSYTSTAFDVLLKAMEPELSTLSQKGSSCAIKTEKLRPNKTVRSPSKLKNSSLDTPNAPSPELVAESQCSPCTSHPAHVASTQKSEQVASQHASHLYSPHDHLVPKLSQQNQQLPGHLGLTGSLTSLHTHESTKLEPVYNIAMPSTVALTPPSTRTQVTPPHQQMDSVSPSSVSAASSTQSPPGPIYSSTHVASVVSQSVEQMCSLLLRDQKPKKQGKYICEYCNRACAKPSVLLKHIRSHTGERPYPCVTCGFSFKTKSNLYKHKKSHAHTIKLGLVLQPEAGGLFLSQECPKALSVHSDIEDSGESEEEGPGDGRQSDPSVRDLQPVQTRKAASNPEAAPKSIPGNSDHVVSGFSSQDRPSESQALTELPTVVVHPVSVPPLKTDSPQVANPKPELPSTQSPRDRHVASILSHSGGVSSLEADETCHQKGDVIHSEGKPDSHSGTAHAQLQRQQATDDPQEQQGKLLLSPRSLGSTDSGYFSRSESADQAVSPPTPLARTFPTMDPDPAKTSGPPGPRVSAPAPSASASGEKSSVVTGQMRPPLATKTLEERISKLISDNEALVDDKQLDSVKPRRTSLSRRGSIDSPKSYIFKDSFQFDLKPMGRRTSSSSDIPKSPFTPTEKSKQVFLLSVPSLDCLPITRSNSMPTTGYSAIPANIIPPPPPLRGSQSFDDKIGNFYDDVFVSGPNPSMPPSGHHRPLVRQAAVEDSTASENHLGSGQSVDESCQGCPASGESGPGQSKAAQTPHLEKKKSHQGRGTMFECETCRNRYRKLENFENHKKFYCSELHGPKTKAAVREAEHGPTPGGAQPQVLHYRVAAPTGMWEQTPQIRKRRKMKSVGDDEDLQPRGSGRSPESTDTLQLQPAPGAAPSPFKHAPAATAGEQAHRGIQRVARVPEQALPLKQCPVVEQQLKSAVQDKMEVKRQGGGISVIQHTNALSRPSSLDKLEPLEGGTTFSLQELGRAGMPGALKVIGMSPEEGRPPRDGALSHVPHLRGEPREGARKVPSERCALGQSLRLVRQHNIQVPEILVTEEPDRDLEAQRHDEEKSEKFTWPQRSETLSKLPTEKLPPKKKRLRLAEIEHSSTESSFESTLSRSLSRESSLSHASSFSASLDVEDIPKIELSPKIDFPSKAEFLLIPLGSNTLSVPGSPREMRRAASEQSSCGPTLMEVSEFRSKSLDCGSIAPSHMAPALVESQPSNSPSAGHVPLLERRRGPLIRQISLNIASDSHLSPGSIPALQTIVLPSVNALPFQAPRLPDVASADCPAHTMHSQTLAKDLQAEMSSSSSTDTFPPQQLFGAHLLNKTNTPLSHQNTPLPLPVSAQGGKLGVPPTAACVSSTGEGSFAPKYQLQCQAFPSGQGCSSSPSRSLPNHVLPDQTGAAPRLASFTLSTKAADPLSKACPLPPLELGLPSEEAQTPLPSFVLPVSQQRTVPVYCFATVTSLPQILVTQDLSNIPVCQTNQNIVPVSEEQNTTPKSQNYLQHALPTPEKDLACKTVLPETGQSAPVSESSPMVQKMSVGRLSPQQESSASSKRMLSPANSLDIAMEKHQKRAKDENGAVCSTNLRPLELPSPRANESQKQKKPVLVRQLCTTEPLEGAALEQDAGSASARGRENANSTPVLPADNLSSRPSAFAVSDRVNELQEFKNTKLSTSLTPTVGNSPAPSESASVLPLKSIDNNQEKGSPGVKHEEDKVIPGQRQPPAPGLSLVSSSDTKQPSFPSLKTATSFTWCYLLRQKALPLAQNDQKTSAYTGWTVSSSDPNPLGLPTKVALSLLNSKQKTGKALYCQAIATHSESDLVVYSSRWESDVSKVLEI